MTVDSQGRRYLPVGLDLREAECLVVGGGRIGTHKALTLVRAGARVTVVAPEVAQDLSAAIEKGQIQWRRESFREDHVRGIRLVVAAADDARVNAAVVQASAAQGVLVCDASSAARSQVIFGALLDTDDLTIAVFSDGQAPSRSRHMRDRIARWLDEASPAEETL